MSNYEEEEPNLSWEKPDWAKNGPTLRSTGKADALKTGNLARPITNIRDVVENEEKNLDFQKPEWTQEVAGKERNLHDPAKPITAAPHADESKSTLGWKKPDWTKDLAGKERSLQDPAKPITAAPHAEESKNTLGWQKPSWTTEHKLRGTKKGDDLVSGKDIARPIGGIKPVED